MSRKIGSSYYATRAKKVRRIDKKVDRLEIKFERLIEALGQVDNFEATPKGWLRGRRNLEIMLDESS